MSKTRETFKGYVMRFSYPEKRKRKLEIFNQELKNLRKMDEDELTFEYIELKTELDHKKNVLSLFIISIAIALLMNAWGKFFSFMEKVLQYVATAGDNSTEILKISFVISVLILTVITVFVLFLLFDLSRDIMIMQRKLMLIENLRKKTIINVYR